MGITRYAVFIKLSKGEINMENAKQKVPFKYLVIAAILTAIGTVLGWVMRNKP